MSTGPVSGIQIPQSTGGPQSTGFDSEHLQIGAKGDERPTEVSKKKGRFGSPLRMVRRVYNAISHVGRKNVSTPKTNPDLKTTGNKFKESVSQGKVTNVQPKSYLSTSAVQSRPLPALPPQDTRLSGGSVAIEVAQFRPVKVATQRLAGHCPQSQRIFVDKSGGRRCAETVVGYSTTKSSGIQCATTGT